MCQLDKPCSIISRDVQLLISFVRLPVVPRRNRTDEMRSRHFVMLTREYDLLEERATCSIISQDVEDSRFPSARLWDETFTKVGRRGRRGEGLAALIWRGGASEWMVPGTLFSVPGTTGALLSSTDIRTFGFDEPWFEGAFSSPPPPLPISLSMDTGAVARAAPICETTDTAVIHLPSGFRDSLTFLPNRSLRPGDRRRSWRSSRFDEVGRAVFAASSLCDDSRRDWYIFFFRKLNFWTLDDEEKLGRKG